MAMLITRVIRTLRTELEYDLAPHEGGRTLSELIEDRIRDLFNSGECERIDRVELLLDPDNVTEQAALRLHYAPLAGTEDHEVTRAMRQMQMERDGIRAPRKTRKSTNVPSDYYTTRSEPLLDKG